MDLNKRLDDGCRTLDIHMVEEAIRLGATNFNLGLVSLCNFEYCDNYGYHAGYECEYNYCFDEYVGELMKYDHDNYKNILRLLLSKGADSWHTALECSCACGDVKTAMLCYQNGGYDIYGSAFETAIHRKYYEMALLILIYNTNNDFWTNQIKVNLDPLKSYIHKKKEVISNVFGFDIGSIIAKYSIPDTQMVRPYFNKNYNHPF